MRGRGKSLNAAISTRARPADMSAACESSLWRAGGIRYIVGLMEWQSSIGREAALCIGHTRFETGVQF